MMGAMISTVQNSYDGLVVREHVLRVPLDYSIPGGETIEVFARELVTHQNEGRELPFLAWFQGGPGNRADRPTSVSGWLKRALQDYRVVLIDQRGTGRSSLINRTTLADRGGAEEQAQYVAKFRADAIVRDAEELRRLVAGDEPWSILGQSYCGFIALN
jgi:pimeloyl-ACP methyl ester carboxylesterase